MIIRSSFHIFPIFLKLVTVICTVHDISYIFLHTCQQAIRVQVSKLQCNIQSQLDSPTARVNLTSLNQIKLVSTHTEYGYLHDWQYITSVFTVILMLLLYHFIHDVTSILIMVDRYYCCKLQLLVVSTSLMHQDACALTIQFPHRDSVQLIAALWS